MRQNHVDVSNLNWRRCHHMDVGVGSQSMDCKSRFEGSLENF